MEKGYRVGEVEFGRKGWNGTCLALSSSGFVYILYMQQNVLPKNKTAFCVRR